jgi:hypothetical protein
VNGLWKPDVGKIWEEKGQDGKTNWDRIQHLGEDGWELVSCFPITTGEGATTEVSWVFKRQRPAK